jgi:hypothetical protein
MKLVEKGQTFEEFILTCAKAFGACIEMRDDPLDTPIPDKFKGDSYYEKEMERSAVELKKLESMSESARVKLGTERRQKNLDSIEDRLKEIDVQNARVTNMVVLVNKWEPPSHDHVELKVFMLEQLKLSFNDPVYWRNMKKLVSSKSPVQYYMDEVNTTKEHIEYASKNHMEDLERLKERNLWIKQLRDSIKMKGT